MTGPHAFEIYPSDCRCLADNSWLLARPCWCWSARLCLAFMHIGGATPANSEMSSQSRKGPQRYTPTPAEWASLTIEPVTERTFRAETVTEGKIAVDEDRSTPVFSPYAGRVTKLLVAAGRQRHAGPAAVRDRGRRHRAGAERFHRRHDRAEQGQVGARSGAAAGQARQGSVRGQGGSAEGLSAEPGDADPGAERSALVADRAGSGAQQAADSRPDRRGDRRRFRKRAASIRRPPSSRRSPARWCSARSAPASMSTPAPAIRCS